MFLRIMCLGWLWAASLGGLLAQGSGFQLNLVGQRQLGMGLAGTSLTEAPSSTYLNPGGLSFLAEGGHVQLGGTAARALTQYLSEQPSTYQVNTDTLLLTPVYLYAAWRGRANGWARRLALGLSVNNPFGQSTRWPDNWRGKFITQEFALNSLFIQPTLAVQLSEAVGLGVGGVYALGTLLSGRAIQIDGPNGTEGSARFAGTGHGWGFNLGLHVKLTPQVQMGLSYRSGIRIRIDSGSARFNVPESVSAQFVDQAFQADLSLPPTVSLGLSYRPQERLLLAFEVNWVGWQRFDSLRLQLAQPVPFLQQYPERDYEATLNLRIGGEYRLTEQWSLRAGVFYDQSPVPQALMSPDIPDANRIGLTTGAGVLLFGRLDLELAFAYAYTGERTAALTPAAFSGIYQSARSVLGLGLGYAF